MLLARNLWRKRGEVNYETNFYDSPLELLFNWSSHLSS